MNSPVTPRVLLDFGIALAVGVGAPLRDSAAADGPDDYPARFEARQQALSVLGTASCAQCHNDSKGERQCPKDGSMRTEYTDWFADGAGAHAAAFKSLYTPLAQAIAANLSTGDRLGDRPTERADCLSCHSFGRDAPPDRRGSKYDAKDEPVGCEACHGRSSQWQGEHQVCATWRSRSPAEWTESGMYDLRTLIRWPEKCLSCHLGTGSRTLDHRTLGAGHPDLSFELATDIDDVPKHWRDRRTYLTDDEGSWYQARLWAVGQAVALRESAARLVRWCDDPATPPPDYAFFECHGCHHDFLRSPIHAPARAARSGTPGQPRWNASVWAVCRSLVRAVAPSDLPAFETEVAALSTALRLQDADRPTVRQAAGRLAELSDALARRVERTRFERSSVQAVLRGIALDRDYILACGPYAADQACRAIETLYARAWAKSAEPPQGYSPDLLKRLSDAVYRTVPNPADDAQQAAVLAVDPRAFSAAIDELARLWAQP
jgi:hypothetical protein